MTSTHVHRTPGPRRVLASLGVCALVVAGTTVTSLTGAAHAATTSSSISATPAQAQHAAAREVATSYAAYQQAQAKVAGLGAQSQRVTAAADAANERASRLRAEVAGNDGGLMQALGDLVTGDDRVDEAAQAASDAADARQIETMVHAALTDAIERTESTRADWERARVAQQHVEERLSAQQYADAAARRARFQPAYAVSDRAQDRRNRAALASWTAYLQRLADAGVTPPAASRLTDPAHLPAGLSPVRSDGAGTVPGVAETRSAVTVLSAETVQAVSESLHRVGLPTVPGGGSASTYSCGAYVAQAWGGTTLTLPADTVGQWNDLQPVSTRSLQVGDVVVLGARKHGLDQSGVFLGNGLVLMADELTGTVGAQPMPTRQLLGVRRATLPVTGSPKAPPYGGACGEAAPVAASPVPGGLNASGSGPLTMPIGAGTYRISAGFDQGGSLWSSGSHTGQDFAAPTGTTVYAAADGVVSIEHPSWAGNLVRIDHGGGVETLYAHLSRVDVTEGQQVKAGEPIAAVGSLGNSTGPHLHFEVRLDGQAVDPVRVLHVPELPQPAYTNGEVPESALCTTSSDGSQHLRCDAAVAYRLLDAAYQDAFGSSICITDSYRSRSSQEDVFRRKPGLAATPGTSNHGWGVATDLCGGIERFDTPEHDWMVTHGPAFGWVHPSWAGAGGSRPEPWDFQYDA